MHAHLNPPADPLRSARTLSSDDIYDRVKDMAARFEFRPNERINEIELSRETMFSTLPKIPVKVVYCCCHLLNSASQCSMVLSQRSACSTYSLRR